MAGGFITLHRQILDWEWYRNTNTKVLFLHLLLTASFAENNFEGRVIHRGQVVSSLTGLAAQLGLTVRQVRVSLEHLKMTGEVTSQSFNRYSVITIVKYDQYQMDDRQNGRQMTNKAASKRQADDRQMTGEMAGKCQHYNNDNNNNNGTMEQNSPSENNGQVPAEMFDLFWKEYPNKVAKQDALKAWKKLKMNPELLGAILNGLSRWKASDEWSRDGGRFIPHPATWLNGHRWEDEVRKAATDYGQRDYADVQNGIMERQRQRVEAHQQKKMNADNFDQRDYSSVNDDYMARLAKEMAEFEKNGGVL